MNDNTRPKTSAQFAAAVDIHYSMASRLRSGERRPSFDLLVRIADHYDLDLESAVRAAHANEFGPYLEQHIFATQMPVAA